MDVSPALWDEDFVDDGLLADDPTFIGWLEDELFGNKAGD